MQWVFSCTWMGAICRSGKVRARPRSDDAPTHHTPITTGHALPHPLLPQHLRHDASAPGRGPHLRDAGRQPRQPPHARADPVRALSFTLAHVYIDAKPDLPLTHPSSLTQQRVPLGPIRHGTRALRRPGLARAPPAAAAATAGTRATAGPAARAAAGSGAHDGDGAGRGGGGDCGGGGHGVVICVMVARERAFLRGLGKEQWGGKRGTIRAMHMYGLVHKLTRGLRGGACGGRLPLFWVRPLLPSLEGREGADGSRRGGNNNAGEQQPTAALFGAASDTTDMAFRESNEKSMRWGAGPGRASERGGLDDCDVTTRRDGMDRTNRNLLLLAVFEQGSNGYTYIYI